MGKHLQSAELVFKRVFLKKPERSVFRIQKYKKLFLFEWHKNAQIKPESKHKCAPKNVLGRKNRDFLLKTHSVQKEPKNITFPNSALKVSHQKPLRVPWDHLGLPGLGRVGSASGVHVNNAS